MANTSRFDVKKIVPIAIFLLVGIFVLLKGTIYYPDSYAFLEMRFNRSPLYATFLKVFTSVFGDSFDYPLIFVQYLGIVAAIHSLLKVLRDKVELSSVGQIVLQIMLLTPCIYWHFTANKILSEAIAYPLFLMVVAESLKMILSNDFKRVKVLSLWSILLVLARGQFVVLVPVLVLILLGMKMVGKDVKIKFTVYLLLLLVPVATNLLERAYNKIVHDYFVGNSMNYVHLISADFYLSSSKDATLFDDQQQRDYFNQVIKSLEEAELLKNQIVKKELDDQEEFQRNFTKICNARVHQIGLDIFKEKGYNLVEQNMALDKMCAAMIFPLAKHHFKDRAILFYKNLKTTFGSSKYLILFFILLLYAIYGTIIQHNDKLHKFMLLLLLFMFANNATIAVVVHPINRYTFYFDWILVAIVVLLIENYSRKLSNEY